MPLAGKMKLTTFLTLAGGTAALAATGVGVLLVFFPPDLTPNGPEGPATPLPQPVTGVGAPHTPAIDEAVMAQLGQPLGTPKRKDIDPGASFKVNVYQDEGSPVANRAKVDLDRDDKWDEKWTWDQGLIQREIASEDDETYDVTMTWANGRWQATGDEAPEPVAAPTDAPQGEPVADAVMAHLGQPLGSAKRKDTTSGQPFKVNVYQDEGFTQANRAKVDLDRDDLWDEKWTWDDGEVSRQIAPEDDENYTVSEVWTNGAWHAPAAIETAPASEASASAPHGRPMDDAVMIHLGKPLGTSKRKDTTSGQPFKVNVYQDDGFSVANRAKIDLDRDDKWDEKWTWKDGQVSRQIAPEDDETYSVTQEWTNDGWHTP